MYPGGGVNDLSHHGGRGRSMTCLILGGGQCPVPSWGVGEVNDLSCSRGSITWITPLGQDHHLPLTMWSIPWCISPPLLWTEWVTHAWENMTFAHYAMWLVIRRSLCPPWLPFLCLYDYNRCYCIWANHYKRLKICGRDNLLSFITWFVNKTWTNTSYKLLEDY